MGKKNTNEELGKGLGFLKDMTEESGHLYDALTSIGDQIATAINNAVEGADNLNYAILGKSLGGMADKLDKTGTLSAILKGNLDKAVTVQRVGQLASIDLVAGLIKGVLQLDKLQTQYNKSFGMTDTQAASVHKRMSQIANASGRTSMTFIDIHKAIAKKRLNYKNF